MARCLENKIAVFSPHTSFDSVQGGVNDWLAQAFGKKKKKKITFDNESIINMLISYPL